MIHIYGVGGRVSGAGQDLLPPVPAVHAAARSRRIEAAAQGDDGGSAAEPAAPPALAQAVAAYRGMDSSAGRRSATGHLAGALMITPVRTVSQQASFAQVWAQLQRFGVGQLVVVGEAGRVVGVVLRADLLGPAWPDLVSGVLSDMPGVVHGSIQKPGSTNTAAASQTWQVLATRSAAQLMRSPVTTASLETPVRRVAAALVQTGLAGLPIVDAVGVPLGWLGRREILTAAAKDPPLDLWG